MIFEERLTSYVTQIERALDAALTTADCRGQESIVEAMRYSALAGGKRLRPVLTLEFCRVSGGSPADAMPFACALEMIHTYSLIHDDLPCMDNDDLRRGKPTNHKVFGEGMAVLAGDSLLTYAFETAAAAQIPSDRAIRAIGVLAHEAGYYGMIGGQVLDLAAEHRQISHAELTTLQDMKTGALIRAAARMGCIVGGASQEQLQAAETYSNALGLAFQIQDDILDIEGDEAEFGKPIGSDEKSGKSTFPGLLGLDACREQVRSLTDEAIAALGVFAENTFLTDLAESLVGRRK